MARILHLSTGVSMRIIADIFEIPRRKCRNSTPYPFQVIICRKPVTADIELAYTLADGLEYLRAGVKAGLDIHSFAPRHPSSGLSDSIIYGNRPKCVLPGCCAGKIVKQFNPKIANHWHYGRTAKHRLASLTQ